ncbi:MAG TPA: tRNA lysidine(34) synthetase TilS [Moorella mulderi]|nr:tRNA lysidine(34) synthetase TilS [Moorella mulderi]
MLETVRATISRYKLILPGEKIVVGVSGGPDSLALLHSLYILREELDCALHVAHLNHGLRPDAQEDALFVKDLAEGWGLPFTIEERDVMAYKKEKKMTVEEAAREVRYIFLREVLERVGGQKIAVGHQADDQAETVLLNLLRGSGLTGLKAMLPRRDNIIRPLLFVSRQEIEDYCRQAGLTPRWDFTNVDTVYRRNKIRWALLPYLAREFNPRIVQVLSRTAVILQEEEKLLSSLAERALAECLEQKGKGGVILDREKFLSQPSALQRRVLRLVALTLGSSVGFEAVERARELAEKGGGATWPGNIGLVFQGKHMRFFLPPSPPEELRYLYTLKVPGVTPVPEAGICLEAEIVSPPFAFGSPDEAWLDWDKLEPPLLIRNWQPGDYFHPLGLGGKKKLQDFFVDAKVPPPQRHRIPLLVSGDKIAWVVGYRLSEDFKITSSTRKALRIKIKPCNKQEEGNCNGYSPMLK